jgi:hypothetical protein
LSKKTRLLFSVGGVGKKQKAKKKKKKKMDTKLGLMVSRYMLAAFDKKKWSRSSFFG